VEVYAIAARDEERAFAYGKKYGIPKVYAGKNGYQGVYQFFEIVNEANTH
jgi:hypothetical protein